jgi:membrane-associated protease RseP (regulator of RpoE activity)
VNYWTDIDRLDLEGGASLTNIKGRVEDPFQLTGMNALGLPGVSIDGILGFTILARFRMEFDPTKDRMNWTRIDYAPKEPFVPKLRKGEKLEPSAEVQLMQAMGPAMKLAAVFLGKQPEEILLTRGSLGIELKEGAIVASVVAGSPAEKAGIQPGDKLTKILEDSIENSQDAHEAVLKVRPGDEVPISLERDGQAIEIKATAGEGF